MGLACAERGAASGADQRLAPSTTTSTEGAGNWIAVDTGERRAKEQNFDLELSGNLHEGGWTHRSNPLAAFSLNHVVHALGLGGTV
jgi:hypothetical protein